MRILLVEDDIEQLEPIRTALSQAGHIVDGVETGDTAQWLMSETDYDLLILDWMLPVISGVELCRQYRNQGKTSPVLLLTAKDTTADKVIGLDSGADDYLVKPIDLLELLARIRALGRRSPHWLGDTLKMGDLELDLTRLMVQRGDKEVQLSVRESQLLEYFLRHPNQVLSRDQLEQSFIPDQIQVNILYIVGDVKNELRLRNLISQYQPSLVFHAAAYKHVPMMENDNVTEAISNNALGTFQFAKSCLDLGVEKFILVSTDKAVNPTNVMGATKRLAEMICQGLQQKDGTRFVIVRFGNVLGSSGSVIPKFRTQIASGGPVTVTHPDITRYFMSIPEAAQLVMQAGLMGKGGEIFVLDMGEPVKIVDLARDMIKLSGFQENEIDIKFTGLRPGEKLYEELIADGEDSIPTKHKKVRVAKARKFDTNLLIDLLSWIESSHDFDENTLKKSLGYWVKDYSPYLKVKQKNNFKSH
jgi:DNA-binding response OmpR family regulator